MIKPELSAEDVASFATFVQLYEDDHNDGTYGWETALLYRVLAALRIAPPSQDGAA